jgi:hypothetical protein
MCLVAEICSLIFGIIAVVTGKFTLSRNRVVRGTPARVVGILLMMPLPAALVAGVVVGALLVAQGKVVERGNVPIGFGILEAAIFVLFFVSALVVAAVNGGPPQPKRQHFEEEEEYEEEEPEYDGPRRDDPRRQRDDRFRE